AGANAAFFACFASAYRAEAGPEVGDRDLEGGARLVGGRLVQSAFQHAAWDPEGGVATGLAVARLAAQALDRPDVVAQALAEAGPAPVGAGERSP
ncbi:MAG TPA: hypothetical protein VM390_12290, partial [Acidimicrobiales bacterium]|nr:hypothetical protein [Acidimicrobiales bacterium]